MASSDGRNKPDSKATLRGLLQAAHHSEVCAGQRIVFVLCHDEEEKTTTVNYLSGMQTGGPTPETVARATRCRDPTREGAMIVLVATPSLRDIRRDVDVVRAMSSTEMCFRRASEVIFLVVIHLDDIMQPRAPKFRALMEDLILLFKSPAAMGQHAVFLFKGCSGTPEEAAGFLARRLAELYDEFIEKAQERMLRPRPRAAQEAYAKMAAFVAVMCEHADRIVYFDPRVEGRSARKVFELFHEITPLRRRDGHIADVCNFGDCVEYRRALNEGLLSGVTDAMGKMQWTEECAHRCAEIRGEMATCASQVAASQEQVLDLRRQELELQRKLAEAEGTVARSRSKFSELKAEVQNYRNFGLEAIERLGQLQPGLDDLAQISDYLDVPDKVVKNFAPCYREFRQQVPELRDCLMESAGVRTDPGSLALGDAVPDYRDPVITDPIITDPIITDPSINDPISTDPTNDPIITDPVDAGSETASHVRESGPAPIVHVREEGARELPHASSKRVRSRERHLEAATRRRPEDAVENARARQLATELEKLTMEMKKTLEIQALRYHLQ